jgi:hypothetical protein
MRAVAKGEKRQTAVKRAVEWQLMASGYQYADGP